jgi:hypothetical protein
MRSYLKVDVLVLKEGAATFHSPPGGTVSGAAAVADRYRKDATSFQPGGMTRFEILQREPFSSPARTCLRSPSHDLIMG